MINLLNINSPYITKVNEEILKIKNELIKAHQNFSNEEFVEYKTNLGKKIYLSPRGSIRRYKFFEKNLLTDYQMACKLHKEIKQTINITDIILNNPEQFSFIPITDGKEVYFTVSKYSKFFKQYFDPMLMNLSIEYTFETMLVSANYENYLFNIESIPIKKLIKLFATNMEFETNPHTRLFYGLSKEDGFLAGIGTNKDAFIAYNTILNKCNFYESSAYKFLLYFYKEEQNITNINILQKLALTLLAELYNKNIITYLESLGIKEKDYHKLLEDEVEEIQSSTKKYTKKDIFHLFKVTDRLSNSYFQVTNLIKQVLFEDIPDGDLFF